MRTARKLGKAIVAFVGASVACVALGYGSLLATDAATTAVGLSSPWAVTVGHTSRTLMPGVDATMPYTVSNSSTTTQRLHGTTVRFKTDGVGVYDTNSQRFVDDCRVDWFRVDTNTILADVDVAPGATANGTVVIAFDDRPVSQDACQNVGVAVDVTAD